MSLVDSVIYDEDVRQVAKVQFGLRDPADILAESVAHIFKHLTKQNNPQNTLHDPRLGATRTCLNSTTGLNNKFDPGNFGHLTLAKPVFNPMFYDTVRKVLNVVCPACSEIRYKKGTKKALMAKLSTISTKKRLKYIKINTASVKICEECGEPLPKISAVKSTQKVLTLSADYGKNTTGDKSDGAESYNLDPQKAHIILKYISNQNSALLGFNPERCRPEWMVITVLPIPPPTMRPSVQADNDKISEDDITHSLNGIIKQNELVNILSRQDPPAAEGQIAREWQTLQWYVATLIDNDTTYAKITNRSHRPLKTIKIRHRGKSGRMRWNLQGKRVNLSGRTVITADPNLSINQVGVPIEIAKILTYPEYVTPYNRDYLTTLVRRGPDNYPGANEIKYANQEYRVNLGKVNRDEINLTTGTTVFRHMLDGDVVLFNRQPSLHKGNMMSHYVVVLPYSTFRVPVNVTPPYNADFDGDEMNLHFPQSEQTVYELENLTLVSTQIVSPQNNKPSIGAVQDSLTSLWRSSSEHTRGFGFLAKAPPSGVNYEDLRYYLNCRQFMQLAHWLNDYSGVMPDPSDANSLKWTFRKIISMFLPGINVEKDGIVIKNGQLIESPGKISPLGKTLIGKGARGGLVHIAWNDLGPRATQYLMDDMSRISSQWFLMSGFSIGLSDLTLRDQSTTNLILELKDKCASLSYALIKGLQEGKYEEARNFVLPEIPRGLFRNEYDQFESDIMSHIGSYHRQIEEITIKNISKDEDGNPLDNRFLSMAQSGAKGSAVNLVQIVSEVGQQDMFGKRIQDTYTRRPTPYSPKDDLSPETRGFVVNSYMGGLSPIEFVYHAAAGRLGVISTSIKTADTGYLQRRLMKVLEDGHICYDNTVRNGSNMIIQYVYGGDGLSGSSIETQTLDHIYMGYDKFQFIYKWNQAELDELKHVYETATGNEFDFDVIRSSVDQEFMQLDDDRRYMKELYKFNIPSHLSSPVNFSRFIKNIRYKIGLDAATMDADDILTPDYIQKQITNLIKSLRVSPHDNINDYSVRPFLTLLRSNLASKKLLLKHHYNKTAFDHLIQEIKIRFISSLIIPGEGVGVLAAQSIGEPATQLTLDTFHFTGVGSKANVSRGVPRLKEIISLTFNPKTPSVTIYIKNITVKVGNEFLSLDEIDRLMQEKMENMTDSAERKALKEEEQRKILLSVKKIRSDFEYIQFSNIVETSDIVYDPMGDAIEDDTEFLNEYWKTESCDTGASPWVLRFVLVDKTQLRDRGIQMFDEIEFLFNNNKNIFNCVFNDFNSTTPICRINMGQTQEGDDPIDTLNKIEASIRNTQIKGIKGISKTSIHLENIDIHKPDGSIISRYSREYKSESEKTVQSVQYVIDTLGTNLLEILNMPNVDTAQTLSNDIHEIYEIFGIEAARRAIFEEMNEVMAYQGVSLDSRHLIMLVDTMTFGGEPLSADRYGVRKGDTGPWARASFEETTPQIAAAAMYGEDDNMQGVSANIMYGQFTKFGTNAFDVYIDEEMISKIPKPVEPADDDDIEVVKHDDSCTDNKFDFSFSI